MGEHSVSQFSDPSQKRHFTKLLLRDIQALEYMLANNMFETGVQRIGAEQELILIDENWQPATNNLKLLEQINNDHFTTEIGRFNLEINSDPFVFDAESLVKLEKQLIELLGEGAKVAELNKTKILLTGIAPTLTREFLHFDYMTPNARYKALNDVIKEERGGDFELNIIGKDELIATHTNILYEACNTSFQVHLQIDPDKFVEQYNWSQMIAGPILSAMANSPILMGKRLWHETRIALFQQSVDTRKAQNLVRNQEPRVAFGKSWLKNSVTELYKENISRFDLLFASDLKEDSMDILEAGKIPGLKALNLHNGTVYRWNRACYGITNGKPHLRIENRYIPSGPTLLDEMANTAFWLGTMCGMPDEYVDLPNMVQFEEARYNFYNAAHRGLESQFNWFGEVMPARELVLNILLPIARNGLKKRGVYKSDIDRLLSIIEKRMITGKNGASWQMHNFGKLLKDSTPSEASVQLTKRMFANQISGLPVHEWEDLPSDHLFKKEFTRVKDVMETDLYTVQEEDSLELVVNMMDWHLIRHIPVENTKKEMVGIINTHGLIHFLAQGNRNEDKLAKDIMQREFEVAHPQTLTTDAIRIMAEKRLDALHIVNDEGRLLGIITESDVIQVLKLTGFLNSKLE